MYIAIFIEILQIPIEHTGDCAFQRHRLYSESLVPFALFERNTKERERERYENI